MQLNRGRTFFRSFLLLVSVVSLPLLSACVFGGGDSARPTASAPQVGQAATPTPEPSPTLGPTDTPVPTATPVPTSGPGVVEILVLREIATCANQLVPRTEGEITPDFTTEFNATDKTWRVEAFNREPALSFGTWRVNDTTGAVAPLDEVAEDIDTPGFVCLAPLARRARGRTPPLFGTPTPTLVPTATPVPTATTVPTATPPPTAAPPPTTTPGPPLKVEAAEDAATAVWVSVYSCYGHFPLSSSFSATLETPVLWVVEGRSGTTIYGLWSVDAVSGEIEPIDEVARQAKDDCLLAPEVPVSLTPAQASLRAWLAVYECFEPPPKFEFFVGQQLTPQRWVVEGREVQEEEEFDIGPKKPDVLYGLWLVDTDTGQILPWDSLAILTAGRACFKQP